MYDGLEKLAVTLGQLRKAVGSFKKRVPIMRKRTIGVAGDLIEPETFRAFFSKRAPADVVFAFPVSSYNKKIIKSIGNFGAIKGGKKNISFLSRFMPKKGRGFIMQGQSPLKHATFELGIKVKGKKAKEMFNRSMLLHENAELAKQPGKVKFFTHCSVKPALNDLNIAATLRGEGSGEASRALRGMRKASGEIGSFEALGLEKLQLGKKRVSRHAVKNIQKIYEKALVPKKKLIKKIRKPAEKKMTESDMNKIWKSYKGSVNKILNDDKLFGKLYREGKREAKANKEIQAILREEKKLRNFKGNPIDLSGLRKFFQKHHITIGRKGD